MQTLPLDQELEATLQEWRRASAMYHWSLRAPCDRRVTDPELHKRSLQQKLLWVLDLEREIKQLRERIEQDDDE